jgi:hypothetical protein
MPLKIHKKTDMAIGQKGEDEMAYDRQRDRGQKKDQDYKIDVDIAEISIVKNNEFQGTVTATVTRGKRAMKDQKVQFFMLGVPLGREHTTDENGKVSQEFSIDTSSKTILLQAQVVGFSTMGKKFIDLPWPEGKKKKDVVQKIPHNLCISFTGQRGKQTIIISITAEDKSPVAGFTGIIIDGDNKKSFKTGPHGTAVYKTDFSEESRRFEVLTGNEPQLIWRARLLGPKRLNKQIANLPQPLKGA